MACKRINNSRETRRNTSVEKYSNVTCNVEGLAEIVIPEIDAYQMAGDGFVEDLGVVSSFRASWSQFATCLIS